MWDEDEISEFISVDLLLEDGFIVHLWMDFYQILSLYGRGSSRTYPHANINWVDKGANFEINDAEDARFHDGFTADFNSVSADYVVGRINISFYLPDQLQKELEEKIQHIVDNWRQT